jgi:hypothetical protein
MACFLTVGLGDTARKLEGDGVSRLSVDDLFMDEYGLCVLMLPLGFGDSPPAFCISLAAAAGFGAPAAAYAVNGFLNMVLLFCGVGFGVCCALFCRDMVPPPLCVKGLVFRPHG